ncbi:MAG: helix-turn-helix transcriptional regulator [Acidimicrobiaceae bacterium]|nr:helix-turn-helix transcriptional regulator [Acidimicrobiaceae bacterium]
MVLDGFMSDTVAANLRRARRCCGWSQAELGQRVAPLLDGVSLTQAQVSALELGRTHLTVDLLVVFAITLGVSLVELVSPMAEVPVPAWASAAFGRPSLIAVSDGELIAEVGRRLAGVGWSHVVTRDGFSRGGVTLRRGRAGRARLSGGR